MSCLSSQRPRSCNPEIEFRDEGIHRTPEPGSDPVHGQPELLFPALDGANPTSQEGGNLLPGIQPGRRYGTILRHKCAPATCPAFFFALNSIRLKQSSWKSYSAMYKEVPEVLKRLFHHALPRDMRFPRSCPSRFASVAPKTDLGGFSRGDLGTSACARFEPLPAVFVAFLGVSLSPCW